MSEAPTPAERADAAATRRRWVTLAEIVSIAGLVIAGLGLWTTWSDRRADDHERRVEQTHAATAAAHALLTATVEHGGERLRLADARHRIERIEVAFPTALALPPEASEPDPAIDAAWIAKPILAATDHGPDTRKGRMPVLVTARWTDPDAERPRSDTAIYDLLWRTEGRLLRGRALRLEGLTLRERSPSRARLDSLWRAEAPRAAR